MKVIKNLLLVFTLVVGLFALASCFDATTTSIEIVNMPRTSFVEGDTIGENDVLMTIKVTDDSGSQEYSVKYPTVLDGSAAVLPLFKGETPVTEIEVVLKGFSVDRPLGTYTAVVTFKDATSYFDYEIVSNTSLFAGGNGTITNPYQITTAEQLLNLDAEETSGNYYKLMNDIDMATVEFTQCGGNNTWAYSYITNFNGTLDGNNKRLFNITSLENDDAFLIEFMEGATIKDLSLIQKSNAFAIALETHDDVVMNNVDIYGNCLKMGNNSSLYVCYAAGDNNLTFINCDSYVDCINIGAEKYSAIFIGYPSQTPTGTYSFENCFNHGYLQGGEFGMFIANSNNCSLDTKLRIVNSGNATDGRIVTFPSAHKGFEVAHPAKQLTITNDSNEAIKEGSITEVATLNPKDVMYLNNGVLMLKSHDTIEDKSISSVQFTLEFSYMNYVVEATSKTGTNSPFISHNIQLSNSEQAFKLSDSESAIDFVNARFYYEDAIDNPTEPTDTLVSVDGKTDWLLYNVEKACYVIVGTGITDGYTYTGGTMKVSFTLFDESGAAISNVSFTQAQLASKLA